MYEDIHTGAENDVLLAYAHNGSVRNEFMDSVLAAFAEDARRPRRRLIEYHGAQGPYIHDNRSRIARYFLETGKQWLWMLDNDMDFPVDTLYRMLKVCEQKKVKILGAAYWNQYPSTECYLSWLLFTQEGIRAIRTLPASDEPLEVTAVGMGCTLIHRSVVQDVADMYPNDPWDTFAADMLVRFVDGSFMIGRTPDDFDQDLFKDRPVADISRMGEDVTFCIRARRAGHISYGLPSLVAEHYKPHLMAHGRRASSEELTGQMTPEPDRHLKEDSVHAAV